MGKQIARATEVSVPREDKQGKRLLRSGLRAPSQKEPGSEESSTDAPLRDLMALHARRPSPLLAHLAGALATLKEACAHHVVGVVVGVGLLALRAGDDGFS